METFKIQKPVSELSAVFAYVSLISIGMFLLLLVLLHFLKSDLSPTWHMVSEYAIGHYGWMMQLAFGFLALSCVGIATAGWQQAVNTGGKMGMVLLAIAAIGLTIAAFNNTDPVNTAKAEMSAHGKLHGLGFMIGVPALTIAALLVSLSLRVNQSWSWARPSLLSLAQLPWLSIMAMVAVMLILLPKNDGKFGPGVFIGLPNRLWVLACCAWMVIIACGIIKIKREQDIKSVSSIYGKG